MHFGWMLAATILVAADGTRLWSRCFHSNGHFLSCDSNLVSGEHCVADLIVASAIRFNWYRASAQQIFRLRLQNVVTQIMISLITLDYMDYCNSPVRSI